MRPKDSPYIEEVNLHYIPVAINYNRWSMFYHSIHGAEVAGDTGKQVEKGRAGVKRIYIK